MRWRTNWCDSERETPLMPNQNTTCSSGETWPVLSRSSTNCAILSGGTVPAAMSSHTSRGVLGV